MDGQADTMFRNLGLAALGLAPALRQWHVEPCASGSCTNRRKGALKLGAILTATLTKQTGENSSKLYGDCICI